MSRPGVLVVFAGLPGVGKTAVSRRVADRLGATFVRIDTVESAIASTLHPFGDSPVGYVVAARVAADQLRSGRPVIADAVNGLQIARDLWVDLAAECGAELHWVEVVCTDPAEHRRRVESRTAEMPGHAIPSWSEVIARAWEPFVEPRLVIDNLGDVEAQVERVLTTIERGRPGTPSDDRM